MPSLSKTILCAAAVMTLCGGAPALAQDYVDSPQDRRIDERNTPLEIEGLALGRDAPFLSSEDLGYGVSHPGRSFEIEGPPLNPTRP